MNTDANTKLNIPDELDPGTKDYSIRKDVRVNAWGYVALALSMGGEGLVHFNPEWPIVPRIVIALVPIVPALLWGRAFARWIRGMDELHRRMTVETCLFATVVTLFLLTASRPLAKFGVFQSLGFGEWWLMDWHSWLMTSGLLICSYWIGCKILHRRYK